MSVPEQAGFSLTLETTKTGFLRTSHIMFQLRESCMRLQNLVKKGATDDVIDKEKSLMMEEVRYFSLHT